MVGQLRLLMMIGAVAAQAPAAATVCDNTCPFFANNDICNDGSDGRPSMKLCELGTDCADCTAAAAKAAAPAAAPVAATPVAATPVAATPVAAAPVVAAPRQRLAVLVAGTLLRYFLASTCERLIRPLVLQGHTVDYFLALSTAAHTPWRSVAATDHLTWDPVFGFEPPARDHVKRTVEEFVSRAGGTLRKFELRETVALDDDPRLLRALNASMDWKRFGRTGTSLQRHADADPFKNFPVHSHGSGAGTSRAVANRNFVRVYKAIEELWDAAEAVETQEGWKYDYLLVLRDDAEWLADFHLEALLRSGSHTRSDPADVYVLSCDERSPEMHPSEINDFAFVLRRAHAPLLGRFYSTAVLGGVPYSCRVAVGANKLHQPLQVGQETLGFGLAAAAVGDALHATTPKGKLIPCASEEMMRWVLERAGVRIALVGQALLPFQRSAHLRLGGKTSACWQKFCQSAQQPLELSIVDPALRLEMPARKMCKHVDVGTDMRRFVHPETAAEAGRAASGCSTVVYTSQACMPGGNPPLLEGRESLRGQACYVAFLDEVCIALAQRANVSQGAWRVVTLRRTQATAGMYPRKLSKVPKHLPHLFFPSAPHTIFLDSKLELKADPNELLAMALGGGAHFAYFGHPEVCLGPHGCANTTTNGARFFDWMVQEIGIALKRGRTHRAEQIEVQLARYQRLADSGRVPREAYTTYADAAIFLRDASPRASNLSEMIATEFLHEESGDRDQPAMSYAFARSGSEGSRMLESVPPYCGTSCHWYYHDLLRTTPYYAVAKLNRRQGELLALRQKQEARSRPLHGRGSLLRRSSAMKRKQQRANAARAAWAASASWRG